ncbi:MAG: IS3 family transposase [Limnochordia bacterium]
MVGKRDPKKSSGLLRQGDQIDPQAAFEFVEREKAGHSVVMLCRVLGVSTSGYYAWRMHEPSHRKLEDERLKTHIIKIYTESRNTYGAPRIRAALAKERLCCSKKRVARLMKELGIAGISRRKAVGCTKRDPDASLYPDLVKRRFVADRPGRLLVADITQHQTDEGWLYIAAVIDVFSRRVAGWAMGEQATAELVTKALVMAADNCKLEPDAIHHSDHGSQYTSYMFGRALREAGILPSMGTTGDAYDNALAESFWASLQTELLDRRKWKTRAELRSAVFHYIEGFYNRKRLHSALDYTSPLEFEEEWRKKQRQEEPCVA